MAFSWVQTISTGTPIAKAAINEIRAKTDSQNDSHGAYCGGYNAYNGNYPGYCSFGV